MASAAVFDLALLRQVEDLAFRPRSNEALVKMQQLFANVKSVTKSWVATCTLFRLAICLSLLLLPILYLGLVKIGLRSR